MARRGRFGRSETGASDLSATIRSLVQQQLAMEEQMLFKAFYEGTPFGGAVPSYNDLVGFVNERLGAGEASDAQVAYYEALLNQAKQFQIKETYDGLKSAFESTNGANFDEIANFLNGEGSDFKEDLYGFAKSYVSGGSYGQQYLLGDLKKDNITREDYLQKANSVLKYFSEDEYAFGDIRYSLYDSLFSYDASEQSDLLQRVNPNKPKQVLAANQKLLQFYQGWRDTLNANGIAGDLLDTVQNNLSQTAFAIQKQKQDIANAAAAALLAGRKNSYEASQATLDEYARQIAPSLGIDSSDPNFSFSDIPPVTMAAALMELPPAAQNQVREAINDLNNKSVAYAQTLRAQGDIAEARSVRAVATQTKLLSGEDVSFERYVAASEQKDALMALADGIPSDEIYVTQEWVKFLKGEDSSLFGAGINPGSDLAGQEVRRNVIAEASAFEAVLNGERPSMVPKTWVDDYQVAERAQLGVPNEIDVNGVKYSGDNKYTAAELANLELTLNYEKKMSAGEMIIARTQNPDGTSGIEYIDAGVPSPGGGILYRIEQSATGKNITVAYKGVPIYGAVAGQVDENQKWGYVYNTKNGNLYVDAKTNTVYTQPPIDVSKLRPSGGLAANGKTALITTDVDLAPKDTNGFVSIRGFKEVNTGVEATINDYVDPAALQSLQNTGINPYARVSPNDPRIQYATGNINNLKNIYDAMPPNTQGKEKFLVDINKIQMNLNSLTGRSEDSGVRIAQMNADLQAQALAKSQQTKSQLPSVAPVAPRLNPFSPIQTGADQKAVAQETAKIGQDILGGANVFFRELGKIGGAIGQAGLMAGGALATGVPSLVGGAVSAGVNFLLPGIPGAGGTGGTSGGTKPLTPAGGVRPLFTAPKPISGAGLTLTAQPFVDFRAGERASLTTPISTTPRTTAPRFSTPTTGRTAL